MLLSKEGTGYRIKFELTYPKEITIEPVTTQSFDVGPRPLGLVLGTMPDQIQENKEVSIPFHIYDLGLNEKASKDVLGDSTWDCALSWAYTVQVKIEGSRVAAIETGEFSKLCSRQYKNQHLFQILLYQ